MSSKNEGGPAFPRTGSYHPDGDSCFDSTRQDGMTLRAWLAGQALSGILSLERGVTPRTAKRAVAMADAVLEVLDAK